jgi:SAM-dependent methyltransferase
MKIYIQKLLKSQEYIPKWYGVFVNPFYIARRGLATKIASFGSSMNGKLLDVGCGSKPYVTLFDVDEYVGLEVDTSQTRRFSSADYFYEELSKFPFERDSFDSILCNQVLEHVPFPDLFLKEINRVVKVNGKLLLTVPFVWGEHEKPNDFRRYTSFGIIDLLERNGFRIVSHSKIGNNASIFFQLSSIYILELVVRLPKYVQYVAILFVFSILNIAGIIFGALLPKYSDLYLDNIVLCEKINEI